MYYDFRVKIPFGKGKVYRISKKDRDAVYVVLEYGSTYLKDRGVELQIIQVRNEWNLTNNLIAS